MPEGSSRPGGWGWRASWERRGGGRVWSEQVVLGQPGELAGGEEHAGQLVNFKAVSLGSAAG